MAPLSVLPGRIRFESHIIVGKERDCKYLAECIKNIDGVIEASANHRTGRVLARFDEDILDRSSLTLKIQLLIESLPKDSASFGASSMGSASGGIVGHAIIDAVAHLMLPKPLNILLPVALNVMRR